MIVIEHVNKRNMHYQVILFYEHICSQWGARPPVSHQTTLTKTTLITHLQELIWEQKTCSGGRSTEASHEFTKNIKPNWMKWVWAPWSLWTTSPRLLIEAWNGSFQHFSRASPIVLNFLVLPCPPCPEYSVQYLKGQGKNRRFPWKPGLMQLVSYPLLVLVCHLKDERYELHWNERKSL